MPKKTSSEEAPPLCSLCGEKPAEGILHVSYDPYEKPKPPPKYSDPIRMNRGWRLYLPVCGPCCRESFRFKVSTEILVKSERGAWGHLDPEK